MKDPFHFPEWTTPIRSTEELTEHQLCLLPYVEQMDFKGMTDKQLRKETMLLQRKLRNTVTKKDLYSCYVCICKQKGLPLDTEIMLKLRTNNVRSSSGINQVTVLTSGYPDIDMVQDTEAYYRIRQLERNGMAIAGSWSCKYDCAFCPKQDGMPRSYLAEEPAVRRAFQNRFDPVLQFRSRVYGLRYINHVGDKIELFILGGTFSTLPVEYREKFIHKLYYAANTIDIYIQVTNPKVFMSKLEQQRPMKTLQEEMNENRNSSCRIIGLTVETRPDEINIEELRRYRRWGVTRVQLGVQHSNSRVLRRVNRNHDFDSYISACVSLRNSGFKFDTHLMFDLPQPLLPMYQERKGVALPFMVNWDFDMVILDLEFAYNMIHHEDALSDQWKIYPCEVVPWTDIEKDYRMGSYKPYADIKWSRQELVNRYPADRHDTDWTPEFATFYQGFVRFIDQYTANVVERKGDKAVFNILYILIMYVKTQVPKFIRLNRVVRDIPDNYWLGGIRDVGLRSGLQTELAHINQSCNCIRCREIKYHKYSPELVTPEIISYDCCNGKELFISMVYPRKEGSSLLGFLRLRLCTNSGMDSDGRTTFPELFDMALIRELHVYGEVQNIKTKDLVESRTAQHYGWGTKLLALAESITKQYGMKGLAVISGEGVRGYYYRHGYRTVGQGRYMVKYVV